MGLCLDFGTCVLIVWAISRNLLSLKFGLYLLQFSILVNLGDQRCPVYPKVLHPRASDNWPFYSTYPGHILFAPVLPVLRVPNVCACWACVETGMHTTGTQILNQTKKTYL